MTDTRNGPAPARPPGPRSARPPVAPPRPAGVLGRGRTADVAALVIVIVIAAVLAVMAFTRGVKTVDVDTDARFPTTPPAEWSAQGKWKSPPLMPKSGRTLVVGTDRVAMVTAARKVLLVDATSGATVWSADAPDGQIETPLARTHIDGESVVAAQFGDTLAWWGDGDGAAGTASLPAHTRITFDGDAPMGVAPSGRAGYVSGHGFRDVTVPQGATPLAARGDGTVTAAAAAGWWHLAPGKNPEKATPWQTTASTADVTVIGYTDSTILLSTGGTSPALIAEADRHDDVRFLFGGRYVPVASTGGAAWSPSPNRHWGIYGRTLVDITSGTLTDLGAWTTELVDEDRALGRIGTQAVLVGPHIARGVLQNREGFPEGILDAGAVARAKSGDVERVYFLPPASAPST